MEFGFELDLVGFCKCFGSIHVWLFLVSGDFRLGYLSSKSDYSCPIKFILVKVEFCQIQILGHFRFGLLKFGLFRVSVKSGWVHTGLGC